MKKLTGREKHILRLILLSCEDMAVPEGGCVSCPLKEQCEKLQHRLMDRVVTNTEVVVR